MILTRPIREYGSDNVISLKSAVLRENNILNPKVFAITMHPRTKAGQRKTKFVFKNTRKKKKAQEVSQKSCDNPGCGCGQ